MRIVMFCRSMVSDWNHGNAHFLRGIATELTARGHDVQAYEPANACSAHERAAAHGEAPIAAFRDAYPWLRVERYDPRTLDLARALDGANLVLVHEWNEPGLVERIGRHRAASRGWRLLFHDTHHCSVTDPGAMARYRLEHYDGVLAFGDVIRDLYVARGWGRRAWTWHEAADVGVFGPRPGAPREGDLIWIGDWGGEERTAELWSFLVEPVRALGLRARVHGVHYPDEARRALAAAGVDHAGWLPNHRVPEVFARFPVTVHVPRRPYAAALPGMPTIRVFEALACGIPLVSAPWDDVEGLFEPGDDFLIARNGAQMRARLRDVLADRALAAALAAHGRRTILARHTCGHRVDELLAIHAELEPCGPQPPQGRRAVTCTPSATLAGG